MNTLSLNTQQKEAVLHKDGPLLIVAGAGAGKTKTLTHRMLNLISTGVAPSNILAITFTNKAAQEMRTRVQALISEQKNINLPVRLEERPFISTFHALCVHLLREDGAAIGISPRFTISDDEDSLSFIKQSLEKLSLDPKQFEPRRLRSVISRNKGDLISLSSYEADAGNEYFPKILARVWREYELLLSENKSLDFDDLITKTVELFRQHPNILNKWQDQFTYIHIDEYQDTNISQYVLSLLLAQKHKNICVVGDMDQSIYSWRGADFRNILNFEKDFPDAKVVLLEENYRSTKIILDAANQIIKKNKERREKNLFTNNPEGEKISLFEAYDENAESYFVANKAKELIDSGVEPKNIAVLYRANFQSRVLEESFLRANIPYQVLGVKFFARKEVKDLLSYIRAALNPESFPDWKRAIENPPRGVGKVTIAKIAQKDEESLPSGMKVKLSQFRKTLQTISDAIEHKLPSEIMRIALAESGFSAHYRKEGDEGLERLENLHELVTLSTKYDSLTGREGIEKLLSDAALASDQDSLGEKKKNENAVRLMTVHSSKGLEFSYVFITGLEDGLFPHQGMGGGDDAGRAEEERRLFYVAITRAEKKVFLSFASVRTIFGQKSVNLPSEFILDIEESLLEKADIPLPELLIDY